jgi:transcriptional regulator with XRE-family HTH domain
LILKSIYANISNHQFDIEDNMAEHFNKQCLLRQREAQTISQDALAAAAGVHIKTIQRAEKDGKASIRTLRSICKVLDVSVSVLKNSYVEGAISTSTDRDSPIPSNLVRSNFTVQKSSRGAMRRTSERYGVKASVIVDLAPALFTLVAEISLARRKNEVKEVQRKIADAGGLWSSISAETNRLGNMIAISEDVFQNAVNAEEHSIEQLDIRGRSENLSVSFSADSNDPLVDTLEELASEIPDHILGGFAEATDDRISFKCCEGERENSIRKEFEDHPDWAQDVIDGELPHEVAKEAMQNNDASLVMAAHVDNLSSDEKRRLFEELKIKTPSGGKDEQ